MIPRRHRFKNLDGLMIDLVHLLDHDNRAIYHHAEIQRPEREQVRRDMAEVETDGRKQQ